MRTSAKEKIKSRLSGFGDHKPLAIAITAVMCVTVVITVFIFVCSFLPVTRFELSGVTEYDKNQLISKAGIKKGDRLYSIDIDKTEKKLLETCPMLEEVTIEREFPNKIIFKVIEKIPQWYIEISGDYYSLDGEFEVIEESASSEKFEAIGATLLVLPNIKSVVVGEVPSFGKDESEIVKALEIISIVQSSRFKARISRLDISSVYSVKMVVDGKFNVYLGDSENLANRLISVYDIIQRGDMDAWYGADIYAAGGDVAVKQRFE